MCMSSKSGCVCLSCVSGKLLSIYRGFCVVLSFKLICCRTHPSPSHSLSIFVINMKNSQRLNQQKHYHFAPKRSTRRSTSLPGHVSALSLGFNFVCGGSSIRGTNLCHWPLAPYKYVVSNLAYYNHSHSWCVGFQLLIKLLMPHSFAFYD